MINALILATFVFTALYISAALVAHLHDCLMACKRRHHAPALTPAVLEELIEELDQEMILPTTPAVELPTSIRGLRDFVREHSLQDKVKEIAGRSVSKLKKDELHQAVTMAIA